jgi:hypothetical protein
LIDPATPVADAGAGIRLPPGPRFEDKIMKNRGLSDESTIVSPEARENDLDSLRGFH